MSNRERQELLAMLAQEEARLKRLDAECRSSRERISSLREELSEVAEATPSFPSARTSTEIVPTTSSEKVALFRRLFRGRMDVFAKRWENTSKGSSGYAPACSNEWVRGICDKPRVKCGKCPNQAFLPITDKVILDHFQGRFIAGIYPMLTDETCCFLAVDFDKGSWQDDVSAFVSTCRSFNILPAVERSRSGNGAHVWFFFKGPLPAATARNMGCFLITETMARRHELSMSSYDRLFPNQDTMPKGGFGNLIALPFQDGSRQQGNSLFVDSQWVPYDNQWHFLASLRCLGSTEVAALAQEALTKGLVIGVDRDDPEEGVEALTPWRRSAPRDRSRPLIAEPLPRQINATLAQGLFIDKASLPTSLLNQIKQLAAFQNPEFYKKQAMRLSTALTPRVISCAVEHAGHIELPRGCRADLEELLTYYDITLTVKDIRCAGERLDLRFHGELTKEQREATSALLAKDTGIFIAPPGFGKTVVGTYLVAERGCSTLVLVHRTPLLEQWMAQLSVFLNLEPKAIGQIGGGKRKPNGQLDVAMFQSLIRQGNISEIVCQYGHVIVDECHHVSAFSFEQVMREVRAKYVTGLTATPRRRDGHHPILKYQIGPVRYSIDPKSQAAQQSFGHRLIIRETEFEASQANIDAGIQAIYEQLSKNDARNDLILDDVIGALEERRSPILLTERIEHLEFFAQRLQGFAKNIIVLRGGMGIKQRRAVSEQLASIPDDEERLILATGRFIGEGFDDARLDTLFLTMPVSWRGTLVQYTGRLHRSHATKTEVRIMDYVDRRVPVLRRMFEKRMRGYLAMGYK